MTDPMNDSTDIEGLSDEELVESFNWLGKQEPENFRAVKETHEQIRAELLNRMSGAGWRSVEDHLPESEYPGIDLTAEFLIADEDGAVRTGYYDPNKGEWYNNNQWYEGITHWRPLPNPPTDD